jgi:Spy/CpxP family protein refolding chaperone
MKKLLKGIGAAALLALVLAVSAVAMQSDDGWFRQRAAEVFARRVERQLNITDAQRERIRTILKTEQPTIEALAARVLHEQLQLNASDTFDETAVRAFAREHISTIEDVLVERQKVRAEIMQALTPDQRKEADQIRRKLSTQLVDRLSTIGDQL